MKIGINGEGSFNIYNFFDFPTSAVGQTGAIGKMVPGKVVRSAKGKGGSGIAGRHPLRLCYGYSRD